MYALWNAPGAPEDASRHVVKCCHAIRLSFVGSLVGVNLTGKEKERYKFYHAGSAVAVVVCGSGNIIFWRFGGTSKGDEEVMWCHNFQEHWILWGRLG